MMNELSAGDPDTAGRAISALVFVACLCLSGCRSSRTIWSGESRSPDGKVIASARTIVTGRGLSVVSNTITDAYVKWAKGSRGETSILELADATDEPVDTHLDMKWLTPTHLELTVRGNQSILFQAVKWGEVDISVRDLSSEKPQASSATLHTRGMTGSGYGSHRGWRIHAAVWHVCDQGMRH